VNSKYAGSAGSDEIDVRALMAEIWLRKWWIAASALLLACVFGIVAYTTTSVYRVSAVLVPASTGGDQSLGSRLGGLAGVASLVRGTVGFGASNEDEALAVLKSRDFIGGYIREKGLMPILFPGAWDAQTKAWKPSIQAPTLALAHKVILGRILSVAKDRTTGLITVSVEWHDREVAATWLNELIDRLNEEMRKRALQQAEASLAYLKQELGTTAQVSVQDAINHLVEEQINKRMMANVTREYAFRVVDRATVPDENDTVRPRKRLLIGAGFVLGLVLGVMGALIAPLLARRA
jgi:uncharacterized protein involved in exopolysaccharide biosynthesis